MCSTTRPFPSLRVEWSQYQRIPQVKGHAKRTLAGSRPPKETTRAGSAAKGGPGACALTDTQRVSAPPDARLRKPPVVDDPGEVACREDRRLRCAVERGDRSTHGRSRR